MRSTTYLISYCVRRYKTGVRALLALVCGGKLHPKG
jgi:hypothetical protein